MELAIIAAAALTGSVMGVALAGALLRRTTVAVAVATRRKNRRNQARQAN